MQTYEGGRTPHQHRAGRRRRNCLALASRRQMLEGLPRALEQRSLGLLIQAEGIGAKVAERSVADNVLEIAGDLGRGLVVQRLLKHLFARQEAEGFEQQGDRLVPTNRGVERSE